jgi:predicted ATP-dependent endonuclease of OLD family
MPLYKKGVWFQEDLNIYRRLLEKTGFKIIEVEECTDKVDVRMRARLKISRRDLEAYVNAMGNKALEIGMNYYRGMLLTHYNYLRYGVIIAEKKVDASSMNIYVSRKRHE